VTKPQIMIIAGPNGSGKSTLTDHGGLAQYGLVFPERYINPDRIARQIAQNQPHLSQQERERAAWRQGRDERHTCRQEGISYACESVFSHPSTLLDMQACQAAGYQVILLFVTTEDVEINVERVKNRATKQNGHNVKEDKIRDRYTRVHRMLPRIVEEAHTAYVFDSSQQHSKRLVFSQLRIEPINEPITLAYDPPNYINEALIQPLETRKLQRLTLSQEFPSATPPDERIGTYTGPIRFACSHYIIQEDSHHGLIRHDLLLFPQNLNLANITTITYDLNNNPHIHLTP
jgi:predicted ABC-type ATPase